MALASFSANGLPVIKASVRLPRVGVWHADVTVDTLAGLTGQVTLASADGSLSLVGTVTRQGVFQNTLSIRVVGGAAGIGVNKAVTPKFYRYVPARIVISDLLSAVGEKLSTTSDAGLLATQLTTWSRLGGPSDVALARVLEAIGASFRVLPDGTTWVGNDTYPPAPAKTFDVLHRYFDQGRIVIGLEQPWLLPGVALTISSSSTQGVQNVSYVTYNIEASRIRADVWFQ